MEVAGDILFNKKYKDNSTIVQQKLTRNYEYQPDKWLRWYFIYKKTKNGIKYFQIRNTMSGKYLDVPEGASKDGLQIQQLAETSESLEDHQLWQIYEQTKGKY